MSGRQAATQLGAAIATLLLAALLTYAALSALPGDPLAAFVAEEHRRALEPAQRAALMRELGLDGPFPLRFARWLGGVLEGDFGTSFRTRRPVAQEIVLRLGPTLELNAAAVSLIAGIGLPLGWWAARRSAARRARWGSAALIALYALPTLWVALVLQHLLSVRLGLLPLYGRTDPAGGGLGTRLAHLALPAATLALHQIAFVTLFARDSAQAGFLSRHAHRARSAGLAERTIFARHGVRPSLVPLAALFGLMVPGLASGSVLIETVFAWPGLGTYFVHAVLARDLPVVMSLALLASSLTVAGSLLADALAGAADPRAAGAAEGRR